MAHLLRPGLTTFGELQLMSFPDYNHLLQLQRRLWQWPHSRAAVMVGAGFSLNSEPQTNAQTQFPTWAKLSRAMFDDIYPLSSNATEKQVAEREQLFNQKGAIRLASEYEAEFGRESLDSFLRKTIPNDYHQPGNIHRLLLQLPWRDIFTTNYDTLLERTYVPERAYQPVQFTNDLTTAYSPRIVKLHGSFSSRTRLIITEEDYRTYPRYYTPFVHTVRQSLIENAFVLLGFSGEDPNFLAWVGWIRDELGNSHAPVYLVGVLSATDAERSLLERRGVTPIDLSPLFVGKMPVGRVHSAALEWFLRCLRMAKPLRPERWPGTRFDGQPEQGMDPAIPNDGAVEPERVETLVSQPSNFDEDTAIKVLIRWRYERSTYPGWLVASSELRASLQRSISLYTTRLLNISQNWPSTDRILLLREILWRSEASLLPLGTDLMEPFEAATDELLPILLEHSHLRPSDRLAGLSDFSDNEVPESWLEVSFALIRDARESYDFDQWNLLKDRISQMVRLYPQHSDRYYYEHALWFLWILERGQVRTLLSAWSPSRHSPLAMMWKAGVLLELDDFGEARSLLRAALQEIRESLNSREGQNIDLLSLEGWCTYLLMPVESTIYFSSPRNAFHEQNGTPEMPELREEFLERWEELKAWDCDPWTHQEYFRRILATKPSAAKPAMQLIPQFDIGAYSIRHSLFGESNTDWLPAYSYIRVHERAGIPLRFLGDTVKEVANWLFPVFERWSPMLVIRAGNTKALKEGNFANLAQISTMDSSLACKLNDQIMNSLSREAFSLSRTNSMQSSQPSVLETIIEFLSRLALRLESHDLQKAFRMALRLHGLPEFSEHTTLNKTCRPWFRRLFDAADAQQLLTWLPSLLRFPLPEEVEDSEPSRHPTISWPDPISDFPFDSVRNMEEIDPSIRAEIHKAIDRLLHNSQATSGETRQRAFARLVLVFHTNMMTEEQVGHFGNLLWENTTANGLPDLPNLTLFNFLHLPSPPEINARSRLRQHLLTLKPRKSVPREESSVSISMPWESEDQMILEVSSASKPVVRLPSEPNGEIEWESAEVDQMWHDVYEWWENEKHVIKQTNENPNFAAGFDGYTRLSLKRASMFLARVVLPQMDSASEDEWSKVLSFLSETRQDKIFLTQSLPYILLHRPSEYDMVLETIRGDLSSDDKEAVEAAAEAVSHWAFLGDEANVQHMPSDVVDDLTKRVIFRRPEGITICLSQLAVLIREKPSLFDSDQVHLILSSLTPWLQATRIPIPDNHSVGFPEHERPLLRVLLGGLASTLSNWLKNNMPDKSEPPEISALRELYSSDPLPEVRRSFGNSRHLYGWP